MLATATLYLLYSVHTYSSTSENGDPLQTENFHLTALFTSEGPLALELFPTAFHSAEELNDFAQNLLKKMDLPKAIALSTEEYNWALENHHTLLALTSDLGNLGKTIALHDNEFSSLHNNSNFDATFSAENRRNFFKRLF
ncbi:MAG: hypothetical protein HQK50_07320 [Oligoflexia bacterium]|nr:hypothetical protein [Oligoflexia bacterium]MBF0365364.1 hypothetical protein [Oligoflexia bacterium]